MNKAKLSEIINDQLKELLSFEAHVKRDLDFSSHLASSLISIITGVRRSGKSSLLKQIIDSVDTRTHNILYLDLEDPRISGFVADDFETALEIWQRETNVEKKTLLFLDEIQNVKGWERWVRYFSEKKKYKLIITGSNSELLSAELGSTLGGRYMTLELFPFSFAELSNYHLGTLLRDSSSRNTSTTRIQLENILSTLRQFGSFPIAYLEMNAKLYPQLFSDIIQRDVAIRKQIRKTTAIRDLGLLLATDNSRIFNLSTTAELLKIDGDITIGKYCDYLEQAYLFFRLRKYSKSTRTQLRGYSKFYCIDPVLAKTSAVIQEGSANFLENMTFLELRRKQAKLSFWHSANNYEVDFILEEPDGTLTAIQVSENLNHPDTLHRECRALLAARKELKADKLLIVTSERVDEYFQNKINESIEVVTFVEFAIGDILR